MTACIETSVSFQQMTDNMRLEFTLQVGGGRVGPLADGARYWARSRGPKA